MEFLLTFLIIVAVVAAMSIGVIYGRKPIAGSCGGLNNLGVDGACEICGGDMAKCEEAGKDEVPGRSGRFYDAA
ncbi:MAG: (Na+)-NQR maturation NqrM [Pseudomonadales bacterium]|nr:(Na+)-NQR maturation NqrM [Pseudomonadales bacterium]